MKRVLSRMLLVGGLMLGTTAVFPGFAADATAPAAKPDAAKGEQLYTNGDPSRGVLACVSCHGAGGNSTIPANPNLAAQPHEYLAKQLSDFQLKEGAKVPVRSGPEGNPTPMTAIVQQLTPQDMANVALYLSAQQLKEPATAGQKSLVERGERIWRAGLADRGVPACASCHSANAAGIPAQYPRLSGQFPAYIQEQLVLFQNGYRNNSEPMHSIASRMTADDIKAVSDYAAGLR
jgi:cytochrome c553